MHNKNAQCYEVWPAHMPSFTYVYLVSKIITIVLHRENECVCVYIFSRAVLMRIILCHYGNLENYLCPIQGL